MWVPAGHGRTDTCGALWPTRLRGRWISTSPALPCWAALRGPQGWASWAPLPSRPRFAAHPALLLQGTLPSRAPRTPALALLLGAVLPLILASTGPLTAVLSDSDAMALCMPRALLAPTPIPLHPPSWPGSGRLTDRGVGSKSSWNARSHPGGHRAGLPSDHKAYTPPPLSNPFGQKRVGTLRRADWGCQVGPGGGPLRRPHTRGCPGSPGFSGICDRSALPVS